MSKLEELAAAKAKVKELEAAAASEIAANKREQMDVVLDHMKENAISLAELSIYSRIAASKYSSGTDTWSGKGKKPEWVEKVLAAGGKIEDYLTKKPAAAATT